jgi:non-ribosomal peptide synthetase component F
VTDPRQANHPHAVALFEHQARLAPEAIALEEGDIAWTYQDPNTRANQIAAVLLGLGCTAETRVAVYLERSREWAASLLGILKAGAVYVPPDPHYPPARVAYMLTDSRPALVLTDRSLRNQLLANTGADQTKTLDLEDVPQIEAPDPAIQLSPRQLAYIIYTSGSTGRPKGAMIEHHGLRNHLLAKVEDLGLGSSDAVAQNSPSSF